MLTRVFNWILVVCAGPVFGLSTLCIGLMIMGDPIRNPKPEEARQAAQARHTVFVAWLVSAPNAIGAAYFLHKGRSSSREIWVHSSR